MAVVIVSPLIKVFWVARLLTFGISKERVTHLLQGSRSQDSTVESEGGTFLGNVESQPCYWVQEPRRLELSKLLKPQISLSQLLYDVIWDCLYAARPAVQHQVQKLFGVSLAGDRYLSSVWALAHVILCGSAIYRFLVQCILQLVRIGFRIHCQLKRGVQIVRTGNTELSSRG